MRPTSITERELNIFFCHTECFCFYRRTVNDKTTGQKVVLSDQDVDTVTRLKQGKFADPNFDPYQVQHTTTLSFEIHSSYLKHFCIKLMSLCTALG